MNQRRKEIARFHFAGEAYDGHSLDTAALEELVQFQKIVTEIAKVIWKNRHPNRSRLPRNFENITKFYFNSIEQGGAIVPLEISIQSDGDNSLDEPNVVTEAIDLTYDALAAVNRDKPLPENIPIKTLQNIAKLGEKLPQGSTLQFAPSGKDMELVSRESRTRLMAYVYNEDSDYDDNAPSINEKIDNIFGDVPDEVWKSLPSDLSHRHDFYLYGITELPLTVEEFIDYIKGPSSPDKEYFTNCKDQVIRWARELGAAEDCVRCSSEPVVDIDFLQEQVIEHYRIPDKKCVEIAEVLMSLPGMGISTDRISCDHCESTMKKDD